MVKFKEKFLERYGQDTDIEVFKEYCLKPLRKSIRVNTLKISIDDLKKRLDNLKQVPWCKEGFFIDQYGVGNLKEHFLGYIYVQEAASMIPALVLNPKDELVLDTCAAPGSKTTHLAAIMKNKGLIVANDVEIKRLKALGVNLQRCGVLNTVMTYMRGEGIKTKFDKILLDAPCSGTGVIRKSLNTLKIWNENMIKKLSYTQKDLIVNAFNGLKDNGVMVYSTCSVDREENENVVEFLLDKFDNAKLEKIDLNIKRSKCLSNNKELDKCLRIWPQDNDTEGFFVAKIKKN
ncbi:MAG: NOL1/NOP2/sun family putative RNA methylase [Nanoarchaeota archaeon]|nr:NOL1/NOP2/sun family putative RNA methylase [Nanoarchaeota archaeon]